MSEHHGLRVCRLVLTGTGFGKINSESLQIHYTCSCLGRHLPVQYPGIGHNCVNQVIGSSNYNFLDLPLVRNLPVLRINKSTFWMWLLYTDATAGHDISKWFFYFLLYRHICDLRSSPTNIEMRLTLLFYLNIAAETFTESEKPIWLLFQIMSSQKSELPV